MAAYLCMTRVRKVQTQTAATVSEDLHLVSNAIVLIALCGPLLLIFQINTACITNRIPADLCDPHQKSAALAQQLITSVFAWMATPPR